MLAGNNRSTGYEIRPVEFELRLAGMNRSSSYEIQKTGFAFALYWIHPDNPLCNPKIRIHITHSLSHNRITG